MASTNFDACLAHVLKSEGGWSDHPADPGGATMRGVTLATFRIYRPGATKADLRNISDAELGRIYRVGYWQTVRADELPAGVDLAVFDASVNSGPVRAIRWLQEALGVPADGKIGPITLAAIEKADAAQLIKSMCRIRLEFLERLGTWSTFGRGWTSRVKSVEQTALSMIVKKPAEPKVAPPAPSGGFLSKIMELFR